MKFGQAKTPQILSQLHNQTKNMVLATQVEVAHTFWSRLQGLLGRREMPPHSTLWIHSCNSIHTYFMRFSIDVIFVDKNLKILKVYSHIKPWRMILPVRGAHSVFEFPAGELKIFPLDQGDQLHVGN